MYVKRGKIIILIIQIKKFYIKIKNVMFLNVSFFESYLKIVF